MDVTESLCQQWDSGEFSYEPLSSLHMCGGLGWYYRWAVSPGEPHCLFLLYGVAAGFKIVSLNSSSLIKAHPLFLSVSIKQKDIISSENTFHYCSFAPWNVMTHPPNISLVNCQQISVLSLPVWALMGPLGSCTYREHYQGCSPGNTPSLDLLPKIHSIPSARKASSPSPASGENGWHWIYSLLPAELEQKLLGPVLNQLGYPSHQICFISSLKQMRALNKTTWVVLAAKSLSGCLTQQRNWC